MSETTKRCQVKMHDGKLCGREPYDEHGCLLHSKKQDKNLESVQKELNEAYSRLPDIHDFTGCVFPEGVVFPKKFKMRAVFRDAVFEGSANFEGAVFHGGADFWNAAFQAEANFRFVHFNDRTSFSEAIFKGDADFGHASFEGQVDFRAAVCIGKANFARATFEDALLMNAVLRNKEAFIKGADFRWVKFLKPEKVEFYKIDLSKFRFLETDVRKVHFTDVDWNKEKDKGRNRVFDEVSPDPGFGRFDYALIAQLYRRLRANYEENLRYAEAGNFYIGEMEMPRKAERNIFKKLPLLFYKAISNYGESYYHPLCWIATILVIFPLLFMFAGIQPVSLDPNNPTADVINYRLDFSSFESFLPSIQKIKDYRTSALYTASIFFLVWDKKFTTINNWGRLLFVLESILSPITLAFFLLALRRRFKR